MICTLTLNASIDKAYQLSQPLEVGSVMRVASVIDNAGGKGLNAARAIATCGERVCASGFVGGNNGRLLCELAERDRIPCDFVHTAAETRCCINVLDEGHVSTEFLEPGRAVTEDDVEALRTKVRSLAHACDAVTINGSVPAGTPRGLYGDLVGIVRDAEKPVILDTSGALLTDSLSSRPTMIKPNTDEIEVILGRKPSGIDEVARAAREVRETYGITQVVVSLGGDGAIMSCEEGDFRGIAPKIDVVNPVGSGDTMVGAFAVGMARHMEPTEQLRYAMACASANCLTPSTGSFEMGVAQQLMEQTQVERL